MTGDSLIRPASEAIDLRGGGCVGPRAGTRRNYLFMAEGVNRRLMVLTEPCMFDHYHSERERGRVPREVEAVLVDLPTDLRERLAASREHASREVRPTRG